MLSSSSLSSAGESDGLDDLGGYTNDEGREGDDEQSDWYHEPADEPPERSGSGGLRPVRPVPGASPAGRPGGSKVGDRSCVVKINLLWIRKENGWVKILGFNGTLPKT